MEQGPTEATIIKQAKLSKTPIPDRILNKPKLLQGLELYLEAFYELNSDRNNGMSMGKIPFTAIKQYADEYEFEGEQRECLFYFIRAIDNAIVKRLNETSKQDAKPSKPRKSVGKGRR